VVARPAKQLGGDDPPEDPGADDGEGKADTPYRIAFWH
jgi:hypothetical protein